jgi:hypothetical protein
MLRGRRDALRRGGYLDPVGDAGGTVTPPQFRAAQTRRKRGTYCVLRRAFHH